MKKAISTGKEIDFSAYLPDSKLFIETGTCSGRTVKKALELGFERVLSVEAFRPFYDNCAQLFKNDARVALWFGKSTDQLPAMFNEYKNTPAVIWLDAHPSGPNTAGHDDLMKNGGSSEYHQDAIIGKELDIILAHHSQHVIIVDDQAGETDSVKSIIKKITAKHPHYNFYMFNETMGPNHYKDKVLVCLPHEHK